jgi:hypothetical protein
MEGDPKSHRLFELYESKKFSDFTIVYQGCTFSLHKCVLHKENEYFENMLDKPWKGLNSVEIPLIATVDENIVPADVIKHYFIFVYTRLMKREVICEHISELFCVANYFLDTELESLLADKLETNVLNTNNILEYLPLYRKYSKHNFWLRKVFVSFVYRSKHALPKDFSIEESSSDEDAQELEAQNESGI